MLGQVRRFPLPGRDLDLPLLDAHHVVVKGSRPERRLRYGVVRINDNLGEPAPHEDLSPGLPGVSKVAARGTTTVVPGATRRGEKATVIPDTTPTEAAMNKTEVRSPDASETASVGRVDMKLEAVVIPVSDVDRAKEFYENLGWRLDADIGKR